MSKQTKSQIQQDVLTTLLLAKKATFDVRQVFALNIDEGVGIVNFSDEGRDFSPSGYDERDTVAGIGIDLDGDKLVVVTSDCEGNEGFLTPDEAELSLSDWKEIKMALNDIIHKQINVFL